MGAAGGSVRVVIDVTADAVVGTRLQLRGIVRLDG